MAGTAFAMALCDDDTVYSWGMNMKGQLGVGDMNERAEPTEALHYLLLYYDFLASFPLIGCR